MPKGIRIKKKRKKKNTRLGLSFEHNQIAISLMETDEVIRSFTVSVPEDVAEQGEIKSKRLLAALLKSTLRENRIKCKKTALAVSGEHVYVRNLTMPRMSAEQIEYNLPVEFRDLIVGDLKDYLYDYADRTPQSMEEQSPAVNLVATAMPRNLLSDYEEIMRFAGLTLLKVVPLTDAYESLIRSFHDAIDRKGRRCFVDIGLWETRLFLYKNDRYQKTCQVKMGLDAIVPVVAKEMDAKRRMALTLLETDFDECSSLDEVKELYRELAGKIAETLQREDAKGDSLENTDIILTGRGARITALTDTLREELGSRTVGIADLFPELDTEGNLTGTAPSVGILLE